MAIRTLQIPPVNDQSYPLSHQVIRAVADHTGTDPLRLPALHRFIDVDALNALFGNERSTRTFLGEISFRYGDSVVTVSNDDEIVIAVEGA